MIILSRLTAPVWIDASRIYPGVRFQIRRLTSLDMGVIRDRTMAALRALREGVEALEPYGLNDEDASGARFNPMDPAQGMRIGKLIASVETAKDALIAWEGVCTDAVGTLAPIERPVLAQLLLDDALDNFLIGEISKASRILATEGKRSGVSPPGSSSPTDAAPTPATATAAD